LVQAGMGRSVALALLVACGGAVGKRAHAEAPALTFEPMVIERSRPEPPKRAEPAPQKEVSLLLDESLQLLIRVHSGEALPEHSPELEEAKELVSRVRLELYDATRPNPVSSRRHLVEARRMMGRLRTLLAR
jgi:hypothetical protein